MTGNQSDLLRRELQLMTDRCVRFGCWFVTMRLVVDAEAPFECVRFFVLVICMTQIEEAFLPRA
jgi:hypothetical protein